MSTTLLDSRPVNIGGKQKMKLYFLSSSAFLSDKGRLFCICAVGLTALDTIFDNAQAQSLISNPSTSQPSLPKRKEPSPKNGKYTVLPNEGFAISIQSSTRELGI